MDANARGGRSDGTYTYFLIRRDHRLCPPPMCGGYWVGRVNLSTSKCHDGRYAESCYVASIDFSRLGFGKRARAQFASAITRGGVLVRGTIDATMLPEGRFGRFQLTEVWAPQGPGTASGVFVKVEPTDVPCAADPCPRFRERKLNSPAAADLAEIDWTASGATGAGLRRAIAQSAFDALIIVGDRYSVTGPDGTAKARTATQFYTRLTERST